jgi:hypothetical protein
MTLEHAIYKATELYDLIGKKVKHIKKGKTKLVSRITAYKKDTGIWDVAIFFESKYKGVYTLKPNCFLDKFIKEYESISIEKEGDLFKA